MGQVFTYPFTAIFGYNKKYGLLRNACNKESKVTNKPQRYKPSRYSLYIY